MTISEILYNSKRIQSGLNLETKFHFILSHFKESIICYYKINSKMNIVRETDIDAPPVPKKLPDEIKDDEKPKDDTSWTTD